MMIKNKIILLLVSTFLTTAAFAQQVCGTTHEMQLEIAKRLAQNKEALRTQQIQQRDVIYLPILFHVVRKNDGTGGVSESKVFAQLCQLNEAYSPLNVVFYLKPINYINDSNIYTNHIAYYFSMNTQKDSNAINIFITQNADTAGGGQGQTLAYYSPSSHWIVVRVDKVGGNQKTLSHELGHFFSLMHTFFGWDAVAWSQEVNGNPVGPNSPGGIPNECQDGSNCQTAGDMICDTPPDYNFGFGWDGCDFTIDVGDFCGGICDPDEDNIMSYFLDCQTTFSPMQQEIILADIASQGPINLPYVPNSAEITGDVTLQTPEDDATTAAYNAILFEWSAVDGADFYFLEIAVTPNFSVGAPRHTVIVYGTTKWVSGFFSPDQNYYWRVLPLNETSTCANISPRNRLTTGIDIINATIDLDVITDWSVGPNPVYPSMDIRINVITKDSFDATLKLYDLKGALVLESDMKKFVLGESNYKLNINQQTSGIYVLAIDTPAGRLSKKIFITK